MQYVLDDIIIMAYVRGDHLPGDIPLISLDCADFWSCICALDAKFETPKFGHRPAREKFLHTCGLHWDKLGGRVSLSAAADFDLLFAQSNDEYTSCCWATLALEEKAPCFDGEFFYP